MAIRDFRAETISSFQTYIEEYYDTQTGKIRGFFNRVFQWLGFFNFSSNANGDAEKYIRSLSKKKDTAETKIVTTWRAVADVENRYEATFTEKASLCSSVTDLTGAFSGRINLKTMSSPVDFSSIITKCQDSYMKLIEARAYSILERPIETWTDEDYEILSYVAVNTKDRYLQQCIINSFYYDNTSEHVFYAGEEPDDPAARIYDRREDEWNKFLSYCNAWYGMKTQDYYDGKISEQEINTAINNILMLQYLDNNGQTVLVKRNDIPVNLGTDGKLSFDVPTKDRFTIFYTEPTVKYQNTAFEGNEYLKYPQKHMSYDADCTIRNGADAARSIREAETDSLNVEKRFDWGSFVLKNVGKVISLVPGCGELGKAVSKVTSYVSKGEKLIESLPDPNESKSDYVPKEAYPSYGWYVESFDLKCVETDSGMVLLPSADTEKIVENLKDWLKDNNQELYDKYFPPCSSKGQEDWERFITNTDVVGLYNDLSGAGVLNDLQDAGVLYSG